MSQDSLDSYIPGNEIFAKLNQIKTVTNAPLRIIVFYKNYNISFNDLIKEINLDEIHVTSELENKNYKLWNLKNEELDEDNLIACPNCDKSFILDEDKKIKPVTYLIESIKNNTMIFLTNNKFDFDIFLPFFNKMYPIVSRVFYRASDIEFLLNKISDIKNIEVKGRDCVSKRLYEDKKTIVTYKEDTVQGFYKRAREENSWVDSIEVLISQIGTVRISRKGSILYSKPFNFSTFFGILIKTILNELLEKRRAVFQNRARTLEKPKTMPFNISFISDYFSDEENINKLSNRLAKVNCYETSLIYVSDGLAHIVVFDYSNGCGFDIYINDKDAITIVPQTQSTDVALEALLIRINDLFEGDIK